jgi:hypothetical protein
MAPSRPREARLYLHKAGSRLIVAAVQYSPDGFLMEAPGPLSLTKWDAGDLAESLKTALEQSGTTTRQANAADWPSLKVSGEPSERGFRSSFIQLDIQEVAGPGETFYRIEATPETKWQLVLRTNVSSQSPAKEIAGRIMQIFEACRDRKF